jgi:hypothetical protein
MGAHAHLPNAYVEHRKERDMKRTLCAAGAILLGSYFFAACSSTGIEAGETALNVDEGGTNQDSGGGACTQNDCAGLPMSRVCPDGSMVTATVCTRQSSGRCNWDFPPWPCPPGSAEAGSTAADAEGGTGGEGMDVDAATMPPWRPAICDDPELGQIPNTDPPTVASLLPGKWFNCGPLSLFQTSDDIGIEILADGTWYKLYWTGTDVVRGVGFGKLGTWSVAAGGICCAVQLAAEGGTGGLAFVPAFATSPKKMAVNTSAGGFETTLASGP